MVQDWRVKDYEIMCFNLLVKLGRANLEKFGVTEREIKATVKKIMKAEKCDRLTALKKYKTQLFNEFLTKEED